MVCYYLGVKIKGASPDSFKALDGGYAKGIRGRVL